jgi:hypothetical protein
MLRLYGRSGDRHLLGRTSGQASSRLASDPWPFDLQLSQRRDPPAVCPLRHPWHHPPREGARGTRYATRRASTCIQGYLEISNPASQYDNRML